MGGQVDFGAGPSFGLFTDGGSQAEMNELVPPFNSAASIVFANMQ